MDSKPKEQISVALCTRNGETYLEEQLHSIAEQSCPPYELIISDDASNDSTIDLICTFSSKTSLPVKLLQNTEQAGVVKNFARALSGCRGNYLALCDQDDIWLPNKLETDLSLIKSAESTLGKNIPLLVHSDLAVIDHSGQVIAPSFMKLRQIEHIDHEPLHRLLVQNFVTGSTVMLNRNLLELSLPIPKAARMHDWWLALVAAACGKVIFSKKTTVLYRQHKSNLIGAQKLLSLNSFKRLTDLTGQEKELAATLTQAEVLAERLNQLSGFSTPPHINEFLNSIHRGGRNTARLAYAYGIGKAGRFRNLLFLLLLIQKGYLKYMIQQ